MNKGIVQNLLRSSFLGRNKFYHYLRFLQKRYRCPRFIAKYRGSNISPDEAKRLTEGMKSAKVNYRWNFEEYFLFDYENLSDKERLEFVSEYEMCVFSDMVNDAKQANVLHDKIETYKKFKKFFKRDAVFLSKNQNLSENKELIQFVNAHTNFIMKQTKSSCGKGISLIKAQSFEDAIEKVKENCALNNSDYLIEELIEQVDEMAEFHPQSVNTVRIPTFKTKDGIKIMYPFMRTGCGDSFVDNAGSGGVLAVIDPTTGKTIAACDENGNDYEVHPDSGKQIVGFTIPQWEEAVSMAKELAMVLPDVKYTGWDLALTNKGWVMVEGNNRGQFLWQYALHRGCRSEFEAIYNQMV